MATGFNADERGLDPENAGSTGTFGWSTCPCITVVLGSQATVVQRPQPALSGELRFGIDTRVRNEPTPLSEE